MSGYDPDLAETLVSGFLRSFRLHFEGQHVASSLRNLRSALEHPEIVDCKLANEIAVGRIAGPFADPPFASFTVLPLRVVPKKTPEGFEWGKFNLEGCRRMFNL